MFKENRDQRKEIGKEVGTIAFDGVRVLERLSRKDHTLLLHGLRQSKREENV